ncbi:acyltransferase [Pedobacter gandavensis]|uniref:Acyltransferase family protein n=1 Tax=Pedobacter gandavensis TaxID=2679963 RepID=A0ABR6F216_9SPHI|nr:acyltransferase [Pedobacter gandavensis]MBB2151569.1 acyltransferase family protein [Pedobacter gandavensis]
MEDQLKTEQAILKNKVKINWLDLLKVIAVFMVIVAHANDCIILNQDGNFNFEWGTYIGSLYRFSVPLFVLISGVLLLPTKLNTIEFYKKRLWRILPALLFWGVAYVIFDGLVLNAKSWDKMWLDIVRLPLSFGDASPHLWYLYMLVGLYLIIPIISPWVAKATKRELELVLAIFIFSTFIPYLKFLTGLAFGVCDWNEFHSFYYLSGFIGYLLMGHYLYTYLPTWSSLVKRCTGVVLFLTGYGITYYLTISVPFSIPNIEMVWYYCSPNVFLEAVGVFLMIEGLELKNGVFTSVIQAIAKYSFGIFLIHYFFIGVIFRYLAAKFDLHPGLNVLVSCSITLMVAFGTVWLLTRIKWMRKLLL